MFLLSFEDDDGLILNTLGGPSARLLESKNKATEKGTAHANDPLKWFGGMVSPHLRAAQASFTQSGIDRFERVLATTFYILHEWLRNNCLSEFYVHSAAAYSRACQWCQRNKWACSCF